MAIRKKSGGANEGSEPKGRGAASRGRPQKAGKRAAKKKAPAAKKKKAPAAKKKKAPAAKKKAPAATKKAPAAKKKAPAAKKKRVPAGRRERRPSAVPEIPPERPEEPREELAEHEAPMAPEVEEVTSTRDLLESTVAERDHGELTPPRGRAPERPTDIGEDVEPKELDEGAVEARSRAIAASASAVVSRRRSQSSLPPEHELLVSSLGPSVPAEIERTLEAVRAAFEAARARSVEDRGAVALLSHVEGVFDFAFDEAVQAAAREVIATAESLDEEHHEVARPSSEARQDDQETR